MHKRIGVAAAIVMIAPALTSAAVTANLQYGSQGAQVTQLQNELIAEGYFSGPASGGFYSLTKKAVIAFQSANGLPATGFVGLLTRAKLNATPAASSTPAAASSSSATSTTAIQAFNNVINLTKIPFNVTEDVSAFSSSTGFNIPATTSPPTNIFEPASNVPAQAINPQTVVLVRCIFTPTYNSNITGGDMSPIVLSGSGVIISPNGYVATAEHVLRIKEVVQDDTNRTWTRQKCQVAQTDANLTPIDAVDYATTSGRFVDANVIFEPSDSQYNAIHFQDPDNPGQTDYLDGGADLDFALLQIPNSTNLPYAPLIPDLLDVPPGTSMIGLGYPGHDVLDIPFDLERIDAQFYGYSWDQSSSCAGMLIPVDCGIRYQVQRYKSAYAKLYNTPSSLGLYTELVRGGFSGGPLFYNGDVAGLIVTTYDNEYSSLYDLSYYGQWDWVQAVTSQEIVHALQQAGITVPLAQ